MARLISLLAAVIGTAVPAFATAVPTALVSHVKSDQFDPGDYGWVRGAFAGASATEVADWKAIVAYSDHCAGTAPEAARAELTALGEHPPTAYWSAYTDAICLDVQSARATVGTMTSWSEYRRAIDQALPFYQTYVFAVERVKAIAPIDEGEIRDQLNRIIIPDQMLRLALSWGEGSASNAPKVDEPTRTVLRQMLWPQIRAIDHRNTEWLKAVIMKSGWPTVSQVGGNAANNAWLLAQHADTDPVFQLRALRLMAPLADQKEVSRRDYAYLYDRVMLPLTGKQRYGTQFTCDATGRHPQPLESPNDVDRLRHEVGLPTLAEYRQQMVAAYGEAC